jgi:hypothetical protein
VSPVPSACGLESKGDNRPNPMVGFLRAYAEEVEHPILLAVRRGTTLYQTMPSAPNAPKIRSP